MCSDLALLDGVKAKFLNGSKIIERLPFLERLKTMEEHQSVKRNSLRTDAFLNVFYAPAKSPLLEDRP